MSVDVIHGTIPSLLIFWSQSSRLGFQYKKEEYTVWRRYRDFEWLHTQLEKTYPTLIVPVRHTR